MRATLLFAPRLTLTLVLGLSVSYIECADQPPTQTLTSISSPTASASGSQHFVHPAKNDILALGSTFEIRWTPITYYKYVTIQLWDNTPQGFAHDLLTSCSSWARKYCGNIATHAPNTGRFDWAIPVPINGTNSAGRPFPRGEQVFYLKMFVEDYVQKSIGNKEPVLSYSQSFAFAKDGESATTVSVDISTLMVLGGLPLETVPMTNSALEGSSTESPGASTVTTGRLETPTPSMTKKPPKENGVSSFPVVNLRFRMSVWEFGVTLLLSLI